MYNVKKKLNSLLSLFLLITLLCAPLTGCNGTNNPEDSQSSIHTETESQSEVESGSTNESTTTESQSGTEVPTTSQQPDNSQTPDNSEPTESHPTESEAPGNSEHSGTSQKPSDSQQPSQSEDSEEPSTTEEPTEEHPTESEDPSSSEPPSGSQTGTDMDTPGISLSDIPAYSTAYYIVLNDNVPHFATNNLTTEEFEFYSELDSLGRCGVAYACLGKDLLPTESRGDIGSVKPSGWIQAQYDCVPGKSLWNRSHLIAFSLAGENANKKNLITGTQHMNQIEMQIFETLVLDYLKESVENNTDLHVMYRVTPFYEGNNLVATGVQMEGWSIEDNGEDICFNVFIYNVQDGITIDYATGESYETNPDDDTSSDTPENAQYVVNGNNGKIHKITCGNANGLTNPIYCETLEEAEAESAKIKGSAQYAGCCMG